MKSRLTFLKEVDKRFGKRYGLYQCLCGKTKITSIYHVNSGIVRSCGCLQKEITSEHFKKHEGSGTSEYNIWKSIKQRCCNSNNKQYDNYGGRGITICSRWKNSFAMFLKDMGSRPTGMSIERKDNNKGYCKSNCKWATSKEQAINKRNNRILVLGNRHQTLQEWSEELDINHRILRRRLALGWSDQEILTTKVRNK